MPAVDFVVNCYERTYRRVLAPDFVAGLVRQQRFEFAEVTVLINNVEDTEAAWSMAQELLLAGEVSRVKLVEGELPGALATTGLKRRNIRRLQHFTDCCLVAACLDGPDWIAYWDADAVLQEPHDWVSPLLEAMEQRRVAAVGNPNNWHDGLAVEEAVEVDGRLAYGFGFSDVAFLARRRDLAAPIYTKLAPASWRYPLAATEAVFEQRVDAWMRRSGRMRVTYLPAVVTHPAAAGANYPDRTLREKVRGGCQSRLLRATSHFSHPALRPWPQRES